MKWLLGLSIFALGVSARPDVTKELQKNTARKYILQKYSINLFEIFSIFICFTYFVRSYDRSGTDISEKRKMAMTSWPQI